MKTDIERKTITLLRRKHVMSAAQLKALISELGKEGRDALRRIAGGELPVEHPDLQGRAVIALGIVDEDQEQNLDTLRNVLAKESPKLKVRALRAFSMLNPSAAEKEARRLVNEPLAPLKVALAAAQVAAKIGGEEIVTELCGMRKRLIELLPSERSPSILSLDRLIKQAEGASEPLNGAVLEDIE